MDIKGGGQARARHNSLNFVAKPRSLLFVAGLFLLLTGHIFVEELCNILQPTSRTTQQQPKSHVSNGLAQADITHLTVTATSTDSVTDIVSTRLPAIGLIQVTDHACSRTMCYKRAMAIRMSPFRCTGRSRLTMDQIEAREQPFCRCLAYLYFLPSRPSAISNYRYTYSIFNKRARRNRANETRKRRLDAICQRSKQLAKARIRSLVQERDEYDCCDGSASSVWVVWIATRMAGGWYLELSA